MIIEVDWPSNDDDDKVCKIFSRLIKFSGLLHGRLFPQIMSAIMNKSINQGKPHIGETIAKVLQHDQGDELCTQPISTLTIPRTGGKHEG